MICVSTSTVVIDSQSMDVLVHDVACASGLVVTTKEELARLSYYIQPLTAQEAGAIGSSIVLLMATAFCFGKLFAFLWHR